MGVPHRELKIETLRNEELQIQNIGRDGFGDAGGIDFQGNRIVGCFCRKKKCRQPEPLNKKPAGDDAEPVLRTLHSLDANP